MNGEADFKKDKTDPLADHRSGFQMSEVKPLSAEQLELLRSLPGSAEDINEDGSGHVVITDRDDPRHDLPTDLAYRYRPKTNRKVWHMYRTDGGDVLLATLQAQLEGERRRINGYMNDAVTAASREGFEIGWCRGMNDPDGGVFFGIADLCIESFEEAWVEIPIEAAANSLNKEQTNGN